MASPWSTFESALVVKPSDGHAVIEGQHCRLFCAGMDRILHWNACTNPYYTTAHASAPTMIWMVPSSLAQTSQAMTRGSNKGRHTPSGHPDVR